MAEIRSRSLFPEVCVSVVAVFAPPGQQSGCCAALLGDFSANWRATGFSWSGVLCFLLEESHKHSAGLIVLRLSSDQMLQPGSLWD